METCVHCQCNNTEAVQLLGGFTSEPYFSALLADGDIAWASGLCRKAARIGSGPTGGAGGSGFLRSLKSSDLSAQ
jgi:hypothetical protein